MKEDEMHIACSTHRRMKKTYKILVGKPEGKRPLGRPGRRWDDIIVMDLKGQRVGRCGHDSSGSG
jgi:hypothetical protein